MRLSVLDLVPVRTDQTTADALAATTALAKVADAAGLHRYWVAEHHNMPAVAATNPPLLIGMIAAATRRIRVGSGGVMLPNHAPMVIAEQFALLEAAHPGRIDLGIGRAPGTDPITRYALRMGATSNTGDDDLVARFPEHVDNVITLMAPEGAGLSVGGRTHALRATPRATSVPPVWLLGSSDYSARLAAARGLPYVFAHHFAGRGTEEALAIYRSQFQPSAQCAEPTTLVTANVCVAETEEQAARLVLPQLKAMVALQTGGALTAQPLVEDAEEAGMPEEHRRLAAAMQRRWIVGTAQQAEERLRRMVEEYDVDEVMVHPVSGVLRGTAPDRSPGREHTIAALAERLL